MEGERAYKKLFVAQGPDGRYRHEVAGWGWTFDLGQARIFRYEHDVADDADYEMVELRAFPVGFAVPESLKYVPLPVGHEVLADFLESLGFLEQAKALRG